LDKKTKSKDGNHSSDKETMDQQATNPFFQVLKLQNLVKIKHNTYFINRIVGSWSSFETSIIWSLKTSFPNKYETKFKLNTSSIERDIKHFREFVGLIALADMLNMNLIVPSELNVDFLDSRLMSILEVQYDHIPEDIEEKLRTYSDQFSLDYLSKLDSYLKDKNATANVGLVYEFWNKAFIMSEEFLGNEFFGIASAFLEIGIAVWTPDISTPGDYILSNVFGRNFEDTIHLLLHTEDQDVSTTELSTRYIKT
jgi:hypothetical protein